MAVDKAITLGHPSYVWREGQERRLNLMRRYTTLESAAILDVGCGLGLYVKRLRDFSETVYGVDVDAERVQEASRHLPNIRQGSAEVLPFDDRTFDIVLSHEVLEHVGDDSQAVREGFRVLKPSGRLVVFVPNRWYPFETHGIFWRGTYHFGNIPLVNYLPDIWRNKLCPHVRAYTARNLRSLFLSLDGHIVVQRLIFAGYDNIIARRPAIGRAVRAISYALERTPLQVFGLSHFLVFERDA
jgi:ubiquinone/menaquinone biosynthesis C-methylase UbiE